MFGRCQTKRPRGTQSDCPSTQMPGGLPSTVPHAKPCLVAVTVEKVEFLCTSTWSRKYWTVPHYLATNDVGSYDNYPRDVDVVYLGSVELCGEASCAVHGITSRSESVHRSASGSCVHAAVGVCLRTRQPSTEKLATLYVGLLHGPATNPVCDDWAYQSR